MTANGKIDPATLGELERLAHSRPRSGREAQAKASAIRTLERLARRGRVAPPPCPPDWHPHPGTAWEELDRLDLADIPRSENAGGATRTDGLIDRPQMTYVDPVHPPAITERNKVSSYRGDTVAARSLLAPAAGARRLQRRLGSPLFVQSSSPDSWGTSAAFTRQRKSSRAGGALSLLVNPGARTDGWAPAIASERKRGERWREAARRAAPWNVQRVPRVPRVARSWAGAAALRPVGAERLRLEPPSSTREDAAPRPSTLGRALSSACAAGAAPAAGGGSPGRAPR